MKILLILSVFLIFFTLERFRPQMENKKRDRKHDITNIEIGLINSVLGRFAALFTVYLLSSSAQEMGVGLFNLLELDRRIVLCFEILTLDLTNYTWHRLLHNVRFLRRFHNVHHTDLFLNSTSALRFHIGEIFLGNIFRIVPIVILGIDIKAIILYEVILNSNIYFHHSNIYIPLKFDLILSKIIVTPYIHRIHHSIKFKESNSNYSSFLILWDKIFKSFTPQGTVSTPKYGIPGYDEDRTQTLYFLMKQPFINK